MKYMVQASLAAFVMLTLAVVYTAAQQPAVTYANGIWLCPRSG